MHQMNACSNSVKMGLIFEFFKILLIKYCNHTKVGVVAGSFRGVGGVSFGLEGLS